MKTAEEQYLELCQRLLDEGKWVLNERTGKRCLTIIGATLTYDCSNDEFPMLTTRKVFPRSAMAEMLGHWRGLDSAAGYRALGTPVWDMNANENKAWLANPNRKGADDCGYMYGVVGRQFKNLDGTTYDQLQKVYNDLKNGYDDRREIVTFLHPNTFDLACLAPCMHTHTFNLLDGELFLSSVQRSIDSPLGLGGANMMQCVWLLRCMAQIVGARASKCFHHLQNVHAYEDQVPLLEEQLKRKPFDPPKLKINPAIKTLEDMDTWVTVDDFEIEGYEHHPAIKYPFSV